MVNNHFFENEFRHELYDTLGCLLTYPTDSFFRELDRAKVLIEQNYAEIDSSFKMFYSLLSKISLENVQEFYSETFELKPKCTLNVGVQIFEEDTLKRSMLMTRLRDAYLEYNVVEETELPDFLPFVMRLSTKIEDLDKLKTLMEECLVEPAKKMVDQFKGSQNPYAYLLKAVCYILTYDFEKVTTVVMEDGLC